MKAAGGGRYADAFNMHRATLSWKQDVPFGGVSNGSALANDGGVRQHTSTLCAVHRTPRSDDVVEPVTAGSIAPFHFGRDERTARPL